MRVYLQEGQRGTWPHVPRLQSMMKLETTLDALYRELKAAAVAAVPAAAASLDEMYPWHSPAATMVGGVMPTAAPMATLSAATLRTGSKGRDIDGTGMASMATMSTTVQRPGSNGGGIVGGTGVASLGPPRVPSALPASTTPPVSPLPTIITSASHTPGSPCRTPPAAVVSPPPLPPPSPLALPQVFPSMVGSSLRQTSASVVGPSHPWVTPPPVPPVMPRSDSFTALAAAGLLPLAEHGVATADAPLLVCSCCLQACTTLDQLIDLRSLILAQQMKATGNT
jgi:hypothetical protein